VGASDDVMNRALLRAKQIGVLLEGIGAGEISKGGGGADIGPLMRDGVPGFGHRTVGQRYFEWHHSQADTLDKIDPRDFRLNVASLAVLAYVLADMPGRIDS
jgi:Zn-dependent M28 family amino/carboxypeptidase